jgi:predicted PurR-regulated permease PerM
MPDGPAVEVAYAPLRIRGRSIAAAVATVGLTVFVVHILADAGRVLAWVFIAMSVAALLYPAVDRLSRRAPRGLAVAVVMLATLAAIAATSYGLVGDVVRQTRTLQRAAPRLAAQLEHEGRFADAAREARISERTERFVNEVPQRLRGGSTAAAFRSAATRGLALLAINVLTLFFLLHGPKLASAAGRQIHDDPRRAEAARIASAVYRRAFGYARGTILLAALAGLFAFGVARAANVPGPAPLALWVALWDAVPLLGATVGALPVVVLAAIADPAKGAILAVAFVAYQAFEYLVLQRRLERSTVKVGPFLTTAAGFAGLELYGLTGALLAMLALTVGAVILDESTTP